jgi:hypothetical protein
MPRERDSRLIRPPAHSRPPTPLPTEADVRAVGGAFVWPGRLLRLGGAAAGAGLLSYGAYSAVTWARYGDVDPDRHPRDELLESFIPHPEVDEYHHVNVQAPAPITFAAAKDLDLQASPIARGVFRLREIPARLRGEPLPPAGPRGIVDQTLYLGWGVLAEVPEREIVIGAYTQPWHEHVTFHSLPPEEFAAFDEPGYAKIAWTLCAEPIGSGDSIFVTRTRVTTTDLEARRLFRRYWAPMSAGIILIRYGGLAVVKRDAERRARRASEESDALSR